MSKTTYIKSYLSKNFPITINEKILKQLIIIVKKYEIKDEHSLALNTPLLGINNILFVQSDRDILFGIFNKNEVDLKKIIKEIPSINKDFIVISDTFNIFCTWVLYNIQKNNKISKRLQYDASFSLLNYFQYRFFSSIVNYYYPYKANEAIMSAVINNLNLKFDIAKYKTWKNVIYKRSENILDKHNIHYKTITTYEYDNDILYLISDTQTKIRNQIKVISNLFHEYKEKNNLINAYTLTANIDGETIIKDAVFIFDGISEKIFNQMASRPMPQADRVMAQEGGLMDMGGMEKDYRNEGGFVPIGGQERADDVPARLSKNEFVFTADAVRAAGGGDIDRGAEVMENMMENLEKGGKVSEESQGLKGARDMFATAQRLEGVL